MSNYIMIIIIINFCSLIISAPFIEKNSFSI